MKLYYHPLSNNCRRVVATIYEIGRGDVELVQVDLLKGEHRQPEFLALNPNGKVPVLVDGDFMLWESTAIMQYLSADSPLWPATRARYDVVRWQVWGVAHLGPPLGKVFFERIIKKVTGNGEPDPKVVGGGPGPRGVRPLRPRAGRTRHLTLADFSVASGLDHRARWTRWRGPHELPRDPALVRRHRCAGFVAAFGAASHGLRSDAPEDGREPDPCACVVGYNAPWSRTSSNRPPSVSGRHRRC